MEGCKCKPAKSFAQRIIEYQEFVSLVRRMREAQMRAEDPEYDKEFWEIRAYNLESEVDEHLKKMEDLK